MARDPSTCGEGSGQRCANSSPLAWRPHAQGQEDPPPGSGRQQGRRSETAAGDPAPTPPEACGGRRSVFPRGPLGCQPAEGLGHNHKAARAQQPPGPRGGQAAGVGCSRVHSVVASLSGPRLLGCQGDTWQPPHRDNAMGGRGQGAPGRRGPLSTKGAPGQTLRKGAHPTCTMNMASSFRLRFQQMMTRIQLQFWVHF